MNTSRRNPFEIVLWIGAVVLTAGSAAALVAFVPALFGSATTTTALARSLAQITYVAGPTLIAVGFAFAGVALAVRAIDYNARRRAAAIPVVELEPVVEPVETPARSVFEPSAFRAAPGQSAAEHIDAPPTRRAAFARPQAPDPSIFMRPRD